MAITRGRGCAGCYESGLVVRDYNVLSRGHGLSPAERRASPEGVKGSKQSRSALELPRQITKEDEPKENDPKEFLQVSFDYLLSFRRDRKYTRVQSDRTIAPYLGKWMNVEGNVKDIFQTFLTVRFARASPEYPNDYFSVHLFFEPNWAERFHSLGVGQKISAIGRLRAVGYEDIELETSELQP